MEDTSQRIWAILMITAQRDQCYPRSYTSFSPISCSISFYPKPKWFGKRGTIIRWSPAPISFSGQFYIRLNFLYTFISPEALVTIVTATHVLPATLQDHPLERWETHEQGRWTVSSYFWKQKTSLHFKLNKKKKKKTDQKIGPGSMIKSTYALPSVVNFEFGLHVLLIR